MTKNIDEILKSISSEILTDDAKKDIATVFEQAVNESAESKVKIVVENELNKMDEDHSAKLAKLVESIDNDHTTKFRDVIKKIDESHTAKLKMVAEKYEKELKEGAAEIRNELVTKISGFMDLYLKECIPTAQLKEAVENIKARKMIEEIKKVVAIDSEFIQENFKEALQDGHDTIEKLRNEVNEKIKESIEINQKLLNSQSELLLERKTKDLPEHKKNYVMKLMENKKPDEIEANFDMVLEMFQKDETEKREIIAESAKIIAKTIKTDVPKSVINEQKIQNPSQDSEEVNIMKAYMNGLKNMES